MELQWDKLLCSETLAKKETPPSSWVDYPMDPFEQDYREIISSTSFRYLQNKAQVYKFCKDEFVRTRLTHSIEVSTVAKQLGIMLVYNKKWNYIKAFQDVSAEYARTIPTVLACAALLHDMGNPPFGHEGEYSISHWFTERLARSDFALMGRPIREMLNPQMLADLTHFEGNAQIIRMLSKCRFISDEPEANVTYATISTLIKYPVSALEADKSSPDMRVHKFGYYFSENNFVKSIRQKTGLILPEEPYARNPLTYLLEAADDIAYITSDIEDVIYCKTINLQFFIDFMQEEIEKLPENGDEMHQLQVMTVRGIINNLKSRLAKCPLADDNARIAAFHSWTGYVRNWLMYVAAGSFVANSEAIMNGTYQGDLLNDSYHRYTVELMKRMMRSYVYPRLCETRGAAETVIYDILNRYVTAAIHWDTPEKQDETDIGYIYLLPQKFKTAYMGEKTGDMATDLYLRMRMVLDYISNLSDRSALDIYKRHNALNY